MAASFIQFTHKQNCVSVNGKAGGTLQTLLLLPCYLVAFYAHFHSATEVNTNCVLERCTKKARPLTTVSTA